MSPIKMMLSQFKIIPGLGRQMNVKLARKFVRLSVLPIVICGAAMGRLIGAVIAQQDVLLATNNTYTQPGKFSIKILGTCATNLETFNCWDPSGTPNSDLSNQVNAYFNQQPSTILQLRFRNPSLLLVTQYKGKVSNFYEGPIEWATDLQNQLTQVRRDPNAPSNQNGESLDFDWIYPEINQRSEDFYLYASDTFLFPEGIKLVVGSTSSSGGKSVTITGISERNENVFGQTAGIVGTIIENPSPREHNAIQKTWIVSYKRSDFLTFKTGGFFASEVAKDGSAIKYVDLNGKPTKKQEFFARGIGERIPPRGSEDDDKSMTGYFTIDVNPKYVKSIFLKSVKSFKVEFADIALRPTS